MFPYVNHRASMLSLSLPALKQKIQIPAAPTTVNNVINTGRKWKVPEGLPKPLQ